jgi:hypothetical protein
MMAEGQEQMGAGVMVGELVKMPLGMTAEEQQGLRAAVVNNLTKHSKSILCSQFVLCS